MPKDTWSHFCAGILALVSLGVIVQTMNEHGVGPAAALTTSLLGVAYEVLQRVRGEGVPSLRDAAATAAPGWLVWLALAAGAV